MDRFRGAVENREARMNFVEYWAHFVRTHTDQEWGSQHANFINALMQNAKSYPFSAEQYLKMKREPIGKSRLKC